MMTASSRGPMVGVEAELSPCCGNSRMVIMMQNRTAL